jgi:hypothetical protein
VTVPKNKGYRAITVGTRRFRWRFDERVIVVPESLSGRQVLEVDFGWFDSWLYANNRANMPPEFTPQIATPAFVASAIAFALGNGWSTDVRGGRFLLKYNRDKGFHLPADE